MARTSVALLALCCLLAVVAGTSDHHDDHHDGWKPPKWYPPPLPKCDPSKDPKTWKDCDPRGWGKGDPIFAGFDDSTMLFLGQPGKIYNVISNQDTQLNVRMVEAELPEGSELAKLHAGQEGTFMATFGLQYMDQQIEVDVDRMGILTSVKLNGTEQLTADNELHMDEDSFTYMPREVVVSIMRFRPHYGQSVRIATPDFDYMLYPTLAYVEENTGARIRGYMNVQVLTVHLTADEATGVTGIMGDTLRYAAEDIFAGRPTLRTDKFEASELKPFDRDEASYEVASLFARPAQPESRVAAVLAQARRRLMLA